MKKRKLKKKNCILVFSILLFLIFGYLILPKTNNESAEEKNKNKLTKEEIEEMKIYTNDEIIKLKKLNNIQRELDYFNKDYLDRYITYKNNNPSLPIKDVITRVNIGLDQKYYTNTKISPYKNKVYILSNKYTELGEYIPDDLQLLPSTYSTGNNRYLVGVAKDAFIEMANAAKAENLTIRSMSAYRSYKYQVGLYQRYVNQDGVEKADIYSARPGFSEHQTGLVTDVDNKKEVYTNFHVTKEYQWMKQNAHKYGFIERYPKGKENITGYKYESWHYRYVGKDIATYIHDHNITFDEYYVQFIENKKDI